MPALPRGICPVCGREVALRVGGKVREHFPPAAVRRAGNVNRFGKCNGSARHVATKAIPALTPARRKALDVLRRAHPLAVRESNETSYGPPSRVYWQTARWLVGEQLAARERGDGADNIVLTAMGCDFAHRVAS